MTTSWLTLFAFGIGLCLVQFLAALPWLAAITLDSPRLFFRQRFLKFLLQTVLGLLLAGVIPALAIHFMQDRDLLGTIGRFYGVLLTLQLSLDFFVLAFALLLALWPRGAAVALAAFREGIRQPMFWFIIVMSLVMMIIMPFLPYFTFGEELKMVKELGFDIIMLSAALFGVLAASMSISEEIEGRTAITLMSKPVSRRQFLIGKFVGILFAALLMTALLSLVFFLMVWFKPIYDREPPQPPPWVNNVTQLSPVLGEPPTFLLGGTLWWLSDVVTASSGLILGFCQVMVLLAIAVALATRLPMVVNLVICLVIFFLGHLTPVLAQVSQTRYALVRFVAQLADNIMPGLDFFSLGPALARDTLPPAGPFAIYIGWVVLYATIYTSIALLFGLILFEDRDLA